MRPVYHSLQLTGLQAAPFAQVGAPRDVQLAHVGDALELFGGGGAQLGPRPQTEQVLSAVLGPEPAAGAEHRAAALRHRVQVGRCQHTQTNAHT